MRRFQKPRQLLGRNESDVPRPLPADNYDLPIIHHAIEHGSQRLAELRVRCLYGHTNIVQESCTDRKSARGTNQARTPATLPKEARLSI